MNLTIRQELRASHVKRWHIVETTKQQSVAEHSFNVAILVRRMAEIQGLDPTPFIMYALEHDLDEVVFGDIPTPSKQYFITPPNMGDYDTPDNIKQLVKLADMLEAIIFLAAYGVGKHAQLVRTGLVTKATSHLCSMEASEGLAKFFFDAVGWETKLDTGEEVAWHKEG